MTKLEEIARAIYAHAGSSSTGQPTWDEEDVEMHEWFLGHARAAVSALLTPTPGMVEAMEALQHFPLGSSTASASADPEELFTAAIQHVLDEEPKP